MGQKKFDDLVEREFKGNWLKDGETLEIAVEAYKSSAENEVIAQLCEAMLNKESAIKAFAKRNTAAAERIRDHIKSFLHMIRDAMKDGKTVLEGTFSYDDLIHYFSETNAERMLDALGESNAQIMPSSRGRWYRCCRGTHRSGRTKTRARNWRSC